MYAVLRKPIYTLLVKMEKDHYDDEVVLKKINWISGTILHESQDLDFHSNEMTKNFVSKNQIDNSKN